MGKIYVMSDIHGQAERFYKMLGRIRFKEKDKLYIIGDLIDRGDRSVELVQYIKDKENIELIMGNHEEMMVESLDIGKRSKEKGNHERAIEVYMDWLTNGGEKTLKDYRNLSKKDQEDILEYLRNIPHYKKVTVNGKEYILIHAGIKIPRGEVGRVDLESILEANIEQSIHLYVREDFWNSNRKIDKVNPIRYIVGHTATRYLPDVKTKISKNNLKRCKEDRIYKEKYKIGIDCGAHLETGKLACLRLQDMKEYYV